MLESAALIPSHRVEAVRELVFYPRADVATQPAVVEVVPAPRSEALSRVVNVTIALVALLVLAPVLILIALAIRLTSSGPVLYSQTRVGVDRRWRKPGIGYPRRERDLGGKVFTMYKFRSMRVDAEADGRAVWATAGDTRTTSIGKFLRKTRLDELPQLYNVIRGDMNIVGPRPERPCIFANLRDSIPEYAQRQRAKPGITGWAQINQPYDACIDDVRAKVKYDLEYIERQSVAEDMKIMAMTLPVMVMRRGAL